jgi:type II secretory pathway pseudopilin PulG
MSGLGDPGTNVVAVRRSARRHPLAARGEAGSSLVELVVSIMLLGVVAAGLFGALVASVRGAATHQELSTMSAALNSSSELVSGPATPYVSCTSNAPTPLEAYNAAVAGLGSNAAGRVTTEVESVETWDGSQFVAACPAAGSRTLELVRLRVTTAQGLTRELTITKRSDGPA